ncbi:MAG: sodium:proton antiporter NhaD [Thiohalomonadales bacterium]
MNTSNWYRIFFGMLLILPSVCFASEEAATYNYTGHWAGILALIIFILAYLLVIGEEHLNLRKSKPVIVAAGIIWAIVALVFINNGDTDSAEILIRRNLLEFAELFLFLLAAMTYINTMEERGIFNVLRVWLVNKGFSRRKIFWLTGLLAFCISPIADNLTTALLMSTVIMSIDSSDKKFITIGCINIVVAANAGGAFSPFGDITTLMVWQKGVLQFNDFFALFIPSFVNWFIPALLMSFVVSSKRPAPANEKAVLQHGAWIVVGLFILTITMAVTAHNFLHLPPVLGMMTGLGFLKFFGYYLKRRKGKFSKTLDNQLDGNKTLNIEEHPLNPDKNYNIFKSLERAEWDTLMFFYGIILSVGGLGALGYLELTSQMIYGELGPTKANILVGLISAIVDNIPVMYAVLTMEPVMDKTQWLLVTLTAGVGGSLLSVGSAAGVAVMGQARGIYTFFAHLKWIWAIALGYIASIWLHLLIN